MTAFNIDDLTVKQIKEISALVGNKPVSEHFFQIGKNYLVQTVTHYFLGNLKAVGEQEIVLSDSSWVSDTGRYHEFIQGSIKNDNVEIEPILQDAIIGRGSIITAILWNSSLPKEVK